MSKDMARYFVKAAAATAAIVISACAGNQHIATPESPAPKADISATSQEAVTADANSNTPKTVTKAFANKTLYSLIAAELALHRSQYELGLQTYRSEALQTRDLEVVKRATQIARILRRKTEATELAELWLELSPSDREVKLILISEYIFSGRYNEALVLATQLIESNEGPGLEDIAIEAVRNTSPEQDKISETYSKLLQQYPNNIDLLIGQSVLRQAQSNKGEALALAERAQTLAPENSRVLYQLYRTQFSLEMEDEKLATYKKMVELQPENFRMRSHYAQMLIKHDLSEALVQYELLHEQKPDDENVLLSIALLKMDAERLDEAKQDFNHLIEMGNHVDVSNLSLGDIESLQQNDALALKHFMMVRDGKHYVDAVSKAANIILKRDGLEQALLFAASRRESTQGANKESLYLIETDMLVRTGSKLAAENLFRLALNEFPDSMPLRYSRAMMYSEQRNTDLAEQDFKTILEVRPDNATVLNALGYTLLDQTDRIEDAATYIEKAYAINPNDAAIVDSIGWLMFKRGDIDKAIHLLEQALALFNDGEISAHLGEALWQGGKKRRAKKVWREALEKDPDNKHILSTLQRLEIEL